MSEKIDRLLQALKDADKLEGGIIHFCIDCMEVFRVDVDRLFKDNKIGEELAKWREKHRGHLTAHAGPDEDELAAWIEALEWVKREVLRNERLSR
jgi:hypothetical protein